MLKGIRIIDFTNYIPGPFATLRLAELGAEVIKVEGPDGDPARNTGDGYVFSAHNRGKKSIAINLKHEDGKQIARGLIAKADALIESFRPGVMEKLGLGYKAVKVINPKIVYCSVTGYGNTGLMAELGSHDLNYMSLSGALSQLKDREGRPIHPTNTFADYIGGLAASERILAGLVSRGLSGNGSYHCLSIVDCMASAMANHVMIAKQTGDQNGVSILNGTVVAYSLYETKDGRFVSLAALERKFWNSFCQALGREEWEHAHYSKPSFENPVYSEMVDLFKSRNLDEWTVFGMQVDCCLSPVLEAGELAEFPYFKMKDFVYGDGQIKKHGDVNAERIGPPPGKGEQTEVILREWLGASEQEMRDWQNKGVI